MNKQRGEKIKQVTKIREKVREYYDDIGLICLASLNTEQRVIDEKTINDGVLYYLQVGEEVLDDQIEEVRQKHKNFINYDKQTKDM